MGFQVFEEQTIRIDFCEFSGPGGTGNQSFFSANPRPTRIDAIMARNPDSIDHTLQFSVSRPGDGVTLGEVLVPALSGVGALAPVDCLTPIAPTQLGCFLLPAGGTFQCALLDALVDAVELDVMITHGEF